MGAVGNAAQVSEQRRTVAPQQEKSNSVLDSGFKDVEPNTRFPKLWAPPVPEGQTEGPSIGYDVRISLIKMLAPSVDKFNEEVASNKDDPIFVGVSFYKRETFITEIEVVNSETPNCQVGSMRTFTTADKNEFGYYGKEVKAFIVSVGKYKLPDGTEVDVSDPLTVDKGDVRALVEYAKSGFAEILFSRSILRDLEGAGDVLAVSRPARRSYAQRIGQL